MAALFLYNFVLMFLYLYICVACFALQIYKYKNIKTKLYKKNAAIWYNKTCRLKQITPRYINIKVHRVSCFYFCKRETWFSLQVTRNGLGCLRTEWLKFILLHAMKVGRVVKVQLYFFFNMGAPAALSLGNSPVTNCTGGWVGLGAGLDGCRRSRPHRVRSSDCPARSESLYRLGLENRKVGRESGHKKGKKLDGGTNYTMRSCVVWTLCQMLLIWSNLGDVTVRDMQHSCGRGAMNKKLQSANLKDRFRLGRLIIRWESNSRLREILKK